MEFGRSGCAFVPKVFHQLRKFKNVEGGNGHAEMEFHMGTLTAQPDNVFDKCFPVKTIADNGAACTRRIHARLHTDIVEFLP